MDSLYIFVEIYANVKKTLVLAVDRDDDYGVKANVETPIIGFDQCRDAAVSRGVVDPEDSDVNGLFAALNIYRELSEDGRDVEVALICGDKKVGHISDSVVIDELEAVLKEVQPDRVILVGDGAEDEYVYPIVSSRVPIDSVKKVYVKQAPGLEGAFYIVSRMLNDYEKRKRFLAPLGYLMINPYLWQFSATHFPSLVSAKESSIELRSKARPVWCSECPGLAEYLSAAA